MSESTPGATSSRSARPLGFLVATYRVALVAPFQVLRGRRLLALSLLVLLPVVAVLLMRLYGASSGLGLQGFTRLSNILYLSMVFPVTILFLGAGAIGDDIDNGTLLYMRLRPVSRSAIVCGRYLAAALSSAVLLAPPVVLLYLIQVSWRGGDALVEHLPVLLAMLLNVLLAAVAYGAFFLLLSLFLRQAVILGLFFVVGWEFLVSAVIPSKAALATVSFHLSAILWHASGEGQALRKRMQVFEEAELLPTTAGSIFCLLSGALVLLLIACLVFRNKEYNERPGEH